LVISTLESELLFQINASGLPEPKREYKFLPDRRYRFDFAWPAYQLAVECNGGTWQRGGHSTGAGIQRDYDKLNLAQLAGWIVLQFTADQIHDGRAITTIITGLGN